MKRLCSALLCLALGCASLAGCSTQEPAPAPSPSASPEVSQVEETYEIGLVQYKEHTALNSLREAFMGRLEEWGCDESQVKIDYQNAGGDPAQAAEICSGFVQQEVDMIVAIATPAAQAAITAAEGTGVTVLFTGVGEVSALGLEDGQKVTGVASPTPVNSLVDLAVQSGSALQTLGLLYDAGEPGALAEAERVKSYCSELGLTVVESTVASEEEAQQAVTELCAQVDALYTPADSTIAPAAAQVAEAAKAAGVPWYTGDASMVQAGALASMGSTGREMGVAAADMAVQLIQGQELAQVPVSTLESTDLSVNQTTLNALTGVTFPAEALQTAYLYQ